MNNRKEPDKEKIENNPYLLLGIPYGSDYNTVNKAFASKSLLYKKEDRDISILTSAVAEIDKICNKSGIEESYYVIPTNPDILSPPIPLARVFVTNNDIPVDSEFDYLMEYTPLQGTIKKIPEPIEAKKEYKSTPEPKSEKEYGFLFIPISLFTIIFIYWVVAFGFNTPMGYLGIGSCLEENTYEQISCSSPLASYQISAATNATGYTCEDKQVLFAATKTEVTDPSYWCAWVK